VAHAAARLLSQARLLMPQWVIWSFCHLVILSSGHSFHGLTLQLTTSVTR
jgi:hypothetical protein